MNAILLGIALAFLEQEDYDARQFGVQIAACVTDHDLLYRTAIRSNSYDVKAALCPTLRLNTNGRITLSELDSLNLETYTVADDYSPISWWQDGQWCTIFVRANEIEQVRAELELDNTDEP